MPASRADGSGARFAGLEAFEGLRGELAAWLLLGFGLAYTVWVSARPCSGGRTCTYTPTPPSMPTPTIARDDAGAHRALRGGTSKLGL